MCVKSLKLFLEHSEYLRVAIVGIFFFILGKLVNKKGFFLYILIINSMSSWNL